MATAKKRTRRRRKAEGESLRNVISLRISDHEMQLLRQLTKHTAKSISALMREAMEQQLALQAAAAVVRGKAPSLSLAS